MKVLLLAPAHDSGARGNLVTVERWRAGLSARGHDVRMAVPNEALSCCGDFDLVHAHHAVHCGPAALACAASHRPVVVSLGGTDLNGGPDGGPDPRAREVYERAALIVGPFAEDGERLCAAVPAAAPFRRVRRGVALGPEIASPTGGGLVAVMAGGIREVKGQLDALRWLREIRGRGLDFHLRIAGPEIDPGYAARFRAAIAEIESAQYLEVLGAAELNSELAAADLLLNASLHEGASNALLEALALGRPVVARRVAGNREMLAAAPREAALLFDDDPKGMKELAEFLTRLRGGDRESVARLARRFVREHHDPETELDELEAVYRELLPESRRGDQ